VFVELLLVLVVVVLSAFPVVIFFVSEATRRLIPKLPENQLQRPIKYTMISVILPVYNEQTLIVPKLQNLLQLNYPHDLLEIIVVDGASQDKTPHHVMSVGEENVRLIRQERRTGYNSAMQLGAENAKGEILVITDAEAVWNEDSLRYLVEDLSDPLIGAVSGTQVIVNPTANTITRMEQAHRKFYNIVRNAESWIHSTFYFQGEFVGC
jgi:cellulose synthase/poly-beta-1,6-N-acetylglucosamine synthase-like glycosyltransferase